jgi:rhamnose transport system permease protein
MTVTRAPEPAIAQSHPPEGSSWLERALRAREISLVVLIVVLVAVTTARHHDFLFSSDGWRELLRQPTILILVGVGEAMVIITRNIDVSVGSIVGLTTYFAGWLFHTVDGIPILVVVAGAIALGTVLGLFNGLLVAFLNVPSLVITLGTLYAYRGIAILWIGGNFIRPEWLPADFKRLGTATVLSIPVLLLTVLVVVLAVGWFMTSRRHGRDLYAVGSNPEAAVLYGLRTRPVVLLTFAASGALAGLAGVVYLAIYATGDSQVGSGYELQAVAAAVVGGVAIVGGSGTIWGVALGAFFLATISSALPVLGIPSLWQQAVVGIFIVLAITLDRVLAIRRTRTAIAQRNRR